LISIFALASRESLAERGWFCHAGREQMTRTNTKSPEVPLLDEIQDVSELFIQLSQRFQTPKGLWLNNESLIKDIAKTVHSATSIRFEAFIATPK